MAWAEDEFGGVVLGDARLAKRLVRPADDLSSHPAKGIPVACAGPAEVKTAYRLLDNESLDWRAVRGARGGRPRRRYTPHGIHRQRFAESLA